MTDRLTLTRALEASGMQGNAAKRIATEIYDAIHNSVATKADVRELKDNLKVDMREPKDNLREVGLRLEAKIDRACSRLEALIVILFGLLFGALHLWPPHG